MKHKCIVCGRQLYSFKKGKIECTAENEEWHQKAEGYFSHVAVSIELIRKIFAGIPAYEKMRIELMQSEQEKEHV